MKCIYCGFGGRQSYRFIECMMAHHLDPKGLSKRIEIRACCPRCRMLTR